METGPMLMIFGGIYLLLLFGFILFWYQFHEMRKNFLDNRHISIKDPIRPIDLTPRIHNGPRLKPKYRSDAKLFDIEQNPAKN